MSNMRQKDLRPAPALIEFKGMKFLITDRPSDVTIHHYIMELKKNNVNTVVRVCEPSYNTEELEAQGITVKDLAFEDGTFPPQNVVDEWFEILKQNFSKKKSSSTRASFLRNKRFSLRHNKSHKTADTIDNTNTCNNTTTTTNANTTTTTTTIGTSNHTNYTNNTNNTSSPSSTSSTTHILQNRNQIISSTRVTDDVHNDDDKNTTCRYQQNPEACVAVHCVAGLGRAPVLVALALIELGLKYEAAVEMIRDKRRGAINAKQLSYLERYKPKARLKHKNGHKNSCCVQ
ncbi:protein-tyrosine phosphatase 4A family member PRL-1 isoform 1-T5 [Cochliomyia hominivorax]